MNATLYRNSCTGLGLGGRTVQLFDQDMLLEAKHGLNEREHLVCSSPVCFRLLPDAGRCGPKRETFGNFLRCSASPQATQISQNFPRKSYPPPKSRNIKFRGSLVRGNVRPPPRPDSYCNPGSRRARRCVRRRRRCPVSPTASGEAASTRTHRNETNGRQGSTRADTQETR